MSMQRVAPLVSKSIGNYLTNKTTWANILTNVKSYGALGDGETDDTTAIKSAISAANELGGGIVYFPPGTYYVTEELDNVGDGVVIQGSSMDLTRVLFGEITNTVGLYADGKSDLVIRDITLELNSKSLGLNFGIHLKNGSNNLCERVRVKGWTSYGIRFSNCQYSDMLYCEADDCCDLTASASTSTQGLCIGADGDDESNHCSILFCTAINNKVTSGSYRGVGIGAFSGDNNSICFNRCYDNDTGINIADCTDYQINDNFCDDNLIFGIYLSNGGSRCVVSRNKCKNNGGSGVRIYVGGDLADFSDSVITDNVVENSGGNPTGVDASGIFISYDATYTYVPKNNIISKNICRNNEDYGIAESSGTGVWNMYTDNLCYDNTTAQFNVSSLSKLIYSEANSIDLSPAAATVQTQAITFEKTYEEAPNIVASVNCTTTDRPDRICAAARNITTTGATIIVSTTDGTNISASFSAQMRLSWIVFGG